MKVIKRVKLSLNKGKILYSSPDFPSSKDKLHPKRPPIQEAPTGQKRYRYAVLPD